MWKMLPVGAHQGYAYFWGLFLSDRQAVMYNEDFVCKCIVTWKLCTARARVVMSQNVQRLRSVCPIIQDRISEAHSNA